MPYKDAHSGKTTEPVTTGQIYWGAIPFVVIQCIMVALIIAFPQLGELRQAGRRRLGTDRSTSSRC